MSSGSGMRCMFSSAHWLERYLWAKNYRPELFAGGLVACHFLGKASARLRIDGLVEIGLRTHRDACDGARSIFGLDHVVEHGLVRVPAARFGIGFRGCRVLLRRCARGAAAADE